MNKKQTTTITLLSVAVIILALLVSSRLWLRLDLTKNKAYTISAVSKNLAKGLDEPVFITYFVTARLKSLYPNPADIEDLMREYTTYSKGKIRFAVKDPEKEGLEQQMESLGIPAQQMTLEERNSASVFVFFSGVLIEYLDKKDVIPVVFNTDTLEYDLTSRIKALISGTNRQAGIICGIPNKNFDQNYVYLGQIMTSLGYEVRQLDPNAEIPGDLTELIVIGGAETFDDWVLYRIDNYIQNGGKVIFLAESVAIDLQQYGGLNARKTIDQGLNAMLASYGVSVSDALVLDKAAISDLFRTPQGIKLMTYPFWVNVLRENAAPDHPITSNFSGIDLFWANPLEINLPSQLEGQGGGLTGVPLITTTELAWLQKDNFVVDPSQIAMMQGSDSQTVGKKVLAAALSGVFPSYWRDKEKPFSDESSAPLPDIRANGLPSRIVVIGNVNFVDAAFLRNDQMALRNLNFFAGAADWLSNDDDIISIRNRTETASRLDRIQDEEQRFGTMAFSRLLNTILIPLAVLIIGISLAHKRKKRTEKD
ncbi:MAG: GldG family protein [Termitinemataceae bacterium]|nr:MAG: GldG family protein [Termitinemataceae bacterium]